MLFLDGTIEELTTIVETIDGAFPFGDSGITTYCEVQKLDDEVDLYTIPITDSAVVMLSPLQIANLHQPIHQGDDDK